MWEINKKSKLLYCTSWNFWLTSIASLVTFEWSNANKLCRITSIRCVTGTDLAQFYTYRNTNKTTKFSFSNQLICLCVFYSSRTVSCTATQTTGAFEAMTLPTWTRSTPTSTGKPSRTSRSSTDTSRPRTTTSFWTSDVAVERPQPEWQRDNWCTRNLKWWAIRNYISSAIDCSFLGVNFLKYSSGQETCLRGPDLATMFFS